MPQPDLHQWFTPPWAAIRLVELFFPDLCSSDLVLEPSCGTGAFLQAIPDQVPAYGVEIDRLTARQARRNTNRPVKVGDFRTIKLPDKPTIIIGNPPFQSKLLDEFLERSRRLLDPGQRVGFLLSVHLLQTPSAVMRWNEDWSMSQSLVPRTLFPRAIRPLSFTVFTKDKRRRLVGGFALYHEASDVTGMPRRIKAILSRATETPTWRAVVDLALSELGGQASLKDIYRVVEPVRPSGNPWWREKIRQTLQRYAKPLGKSQWALAS